MSEEQQDSIQSTIQEALARRAVRENALLVEQQKADAAREAAAVSILGFYETNILPLLRKTLDELRKSGIEAELALEAEARRACLVVTMAGASSRLCFYAGAEYGTPHIVHSQRTQRSPDFSAQITAPTAQGILGILQGFLRDAIASQ